MRITGLVVVTALAAAFAAPAAGAAPRAATADAGDLGVRIVSLAFHAPTPACPVLKARLGLTSDAGPGSGTVCFQAIDFCHISVAWWTLRLPGGTAQALVAQRERCTFDAAGNPTSVDVTFEGTVGRASGTLASHTGGRLAGGGTTTFSASGEPSPDLTITLGAGRAAVTAFDGSDAGSFAVIPSPDPSLLLSQDHASGRARQLGRYALVAQEAVDPVALTVSAGSFILSTRNGSIFGTYSGFGEPGATSSAITYLVSGPITGGTGRFAGASGTVAFDGRADFATGQLSDRLFGVVATDAP
jgi:hypothetical protein